MSEEMTVAADARTEEQWIESLAEPVFEHMATRVKEEEVEKIRRVFELARRAHAPQRRKSGEPYIIHPIAVASIVGIELGLGANPVCAAFLHDVVEDTDTTIEQISEQFGDDVAFLVKVVTKKKKDHYETSQQVDNFRQMLDSINYDIRALLIKLADRLHNMRTLNSMKPEKQMKIAGETDYFYAPLANRLGLYRIKLELENLSFKYRCPKEYAALEQQLKDYEQQQRPSLDSFMKSIRRQLESQGLEVFVEAEFRRPFSVRRKMEKTGCDFRHVDNRQFVRVVFPEDSYGLTEKEAALKIYSLLTDVFKEKPGSVVNYIDSPKENGYQSLHVKLLTDHGEWEEVHISSRRMRKVSRCGCVADRVESAIDKWIERLKSTLHDIAEGDSRLEFMEGVTTSFYNDDIRVFTTKGKTVTLPQKSTALDFAFEVLDKDALHAKYARVNGKLCSLCTTLKRGDCVEIGVEKEMWPHREWREHVLTYRAKKHLSDYFMSLPVPKVSRCSHCNPLPGDEVMGFRNPDGVLEIHKRDCQRLIQKSSQMGDRVTGVDFPAEPDTLYPVTLKVRAVDRYHLLPEIIDCISDRLSLSMTGLTTQTVDEIAECHVNFSVHSSDELRSAIAAINEIAGVDEVMRE